MRKSMALLALAWGLCFPAVAQEQQQEQRTPEERAARQTEMLARQLSLTEEQHRQVYNMNLKAALQLQEALKTGDTKGMRAAMESREHELMLILTADQQQDYQAIRQQQMERRRERLNGNGTGMPPAEQ